MDVYAQTVYLSVPDRMPALTAEDIHRMINELTYIEQVMKKWRDDHK